MFTDSKRLREKRAEIVEEMGILNTLAAGEERDLTAEEKEKFDELDKKQEALKSQYERMERAYDLQKEMEEKVEARDLPIEQNTETAKPEEKKESRSKAFEKFLRFGMDELDEGERKIMGELRTSLTPEMRAQSVGTNSAGGYIVPEGFQAELEKALLDFGGMFEAARILRTATGNDLPWPTVNDTGNKGSILAENTQDGEQDITFGSVTLNAYKYTSDIVRVSLELLQDSAFNLNAEIPMMLGERLARIMNEHATTGTGSSQPRGIAVAAATTAAAANSAVTYTDLTNLQHSVDPAYRRRSGTRFMFNDSTLKSIKQLVDGDSRPLWAAGIAVREPDTILGHPYTINQDVADIGSNAESVLFGDFSKYIMRIVLDTQMMRLTERYADFLQVGFLAFMRFDGELIDAGTNPIKALSHPA